MIRKILFWGDSITDGNRLKGRENEWDLNHQIGHCYAYLISAKLGYTCPERGYTFLDRGVSGYKIADLYAHLLDDVLPDHPDCVSILVGINDCVQRIRLGLEPDPVWFEDTYRAVLRNLRQQNPDMALVLCEPFCLPVGAVAETYDTCREALRPLQACVRALASEFHGIFVPLQTPFDEASAKNGASYWSWDGIHPTVSGHALAADAWLKACAPLFA